MATLPASSEPFGAQPTPPPMPRSHTLGYVGPTGTMFGIFYKNLILTVLTLGIYRFWAKTRLRRFQWANTQIDGEGFEYTGTGKELFFGFLKAALILVPLFGGLQLIELFVLDESMVGIAVLGFLRAILVVGLISAATFSARKYRMSRTTWRGIRLHQAGSMWTYAGIALLGILFTALTLGLYLPFLQAKLMRYEIGNLRFGSASFYFSGKGKTLFRLFLRGWGAMIALILVMGGIGLLLPRGAESGAAGTGLYILVAILAFAPIVLIVLFALWYQARSYRFQAESASLEDVSFAMPRLSGWQIFKLMFGNALIVALTLGIFLPLTTQRTMRFWVRHTQLAGDIDLDHIAQAERGPATGEGLAGFFDIDLG
jgi:uncharacterized membrane protein YjgN (DUF898 family)